jgi:hypothetical protein
MNDPKRWSDGDSTIDPVLRSVLRYAKDFAPTSSETQSLLRRVRVAANERRAAAAPRVAMRRLSQGRAAALALALGMGVGAVAWAGYATYLARTEIAPGERSPSTVNPSRSPGATRMPPAVLPVASVSASGTLTSPNSAFSAKVRDSSRVANPPTAGSTGADSLQSEAELLQAARARLGSDPEGVQRLIAEHVSRFPNSALAEERSALAVEARLRSGGGAEAERALLRFETDYPRSPYRRRLRALLAQ